MGVVITEEYNVMVNSKEFTGYTEYLSLYTRCRINRCRYNGGSIVSPELWFWILNVCHKVVPHEMSAKL